jgi:hypothetical protein
MAIDENAIYNIMVGGTTNLTTVLDAPAFASNGNFFLISKDAQTQMSLPTDAKGNQFVSDANTGNSFFVIEKYSGSTL